MSEIKQKGSKPAVLFGSKNVTRAGYIEDYIFACEIKGEDHIVYKKPRRPKYHLVIIILSGTMELIVNGERLRFTKNTYVNLPTWADIYEIGYGKDFHAMATATDKSVVEDIFQNRNPFPPDFKFTIDHGIGGEIMNKKDIDTYFGLETLKLIVNQPFAATGTEGKFDIIALVNGGGLSGQAGAIRHGLARALVQADENNKPALKAAGFLTRDPRMKERKKYGLKGARRAPQFSKR